MKEVRYPSKSVFDTFSGAKKVSQTRVEMKIFVFVFSRKFCENFFSLFAKKAHEKLRKCSRKFSFSRKFGMRIRIQGPSECVSRSEALVENFHKNENIMQKPSREQNFSRKLSQKRKPLFLNSRKAKIRSLLAKFCEKWAKIFRFPESFRVTKFRKISRKVCEFSLIFASRENEKRGFRFNPILDGNRD
jgi:hypothetical protein